MVNSLKHLLGATAFACAATGALGMPDSVELKLQVDPTVFAQTREAGYEAVWKVLTETAAKHGMTAEVNPVATSEEEAQYVYYYDTEDQDFGSRNYTIRQTFPCENGAKSERGTLTVKLRQPDELTKTQIARFLEGLGQEKIHKYEADTVGLVQNVPGRLRTVYSVSAKQRGMLDANTRDVRWLAQDFPIAAQLGLDPALTLVPVREPVFAVQTALGSILYNGQRADIDVVLWYDEDGKTLKLVELSWKYRTEQMSPAMHKTLHAALQQRTDMFVAGKNKTEC